MPFDPEVGDRLDIEEVVYRFTRQPGARGVEMPYSEEGRKGIVYQLEAADGSHHALKVFKPGYREPRIVDTSVQLRKFARLKGLKACSRKVLTRQCHADLIRMYPDLEYSVLMPWVGGGTWQEVVQKRKPLGPEQSRALAQAFARVLTGMEERSMAHCDLSGPNVVVSEGLDGVSLVDVEDLYAPGLPRPATPPGGSSGYARNGMSAEGLWGPHADRFAGAVLFGEMLGWCDGRMREAAAGEAYFLPQEMQTECERYRVLVGVLGERWGMGVVEALTAAWRSRSLEECPSLGEWARTVKAAAPPTVGDMVADAERLLELDKTDAAIGVLRDAYRKDREVAGAAFADALHVRGQRKQREGDHEGALADYRDAQRVVPPGAHADQLESLIRRLAERVHPNGGAKGILQDPSADRRGGSRPLGEISGVEPRREDDKQLPPPPGRHRLAALAAIASSVCVATFAMLVLAGGPEGLFFLANVISALAGLILAVKTVTNPMVRNGIQPGRVLAIASMIVCALMLSFWCLAILLVLLA